MSWVRNAESLLNFFIGHRRILGVKRPSGHPKGWLDPLGSSDDDGKIEAPPLPTRGKGQWAAEGFEWIYICCLSGCNSKVWSYNGKGPKRRRGFTTPVVEKKWLAIKCTIRKLQDPVNLPEKQIRYYSKYFNHLRREKLFVSIPTGIFSLPHFLFK